MLNALLDDPALGTTDRGSLKLLNVGGSPVTPARLREGDRALRSGRSDDLRPERAAVSSPRFPA